MNILISIDNLGIGGAQKFALRLAQALSKKHQVYIFSHASYKQKIQELPFVEEVSPDVKVIYLPFILYFIAWVAFKIDNLILSRLKIELRLYEIIKSFYFKKIISKHHIDIINSHLFYSDSFVVSSSVNHRIPIIVTDHGDYRNVVQYGDYTWEQVYNTLSKVDAIIYPCQYNAQHLSKKIGNIRAIQETIYYGLLTEDREIYHESGRQKLGISEDAFVFGMVARGIPEKGWAEAIEAFYLLKKSEKDREMHLILVGGDDYLSSLQQIWESKLIDSIHFVGYSSEPSYWVQSFNVGLLPTYLIGESLPNSIIEYLILGKPVIATEVGGIPEMMDHNGQIPGFLISLNQDRKADISMMADAMSKYINESELLERHSSLAKQAFEKFKMQTCIEAYELLFEKLLSKASFVD
jgi:L-malate glycosyltransferase